MRGYCNDESSDKEVTSCFSMMRKMKTTIANENLSSMTSAKNPCNIRHKVITSESNGEEDMQLASIFRWIFVELQAECQKFHKHSFFDNANIVTSEYISTRAWHLK
jgi:spore germination protein GerM